MRSQGRQVWRAVHRRDGRGPGARARGARRRAGHLRRRAAADAGLRHRRLRRCCCCCRRRARSSAGRSSRRVARHGAVRLGTWAAGRRSQRGPGRPPGDTTTTSRAPPPRSTQRRRLTVSLDDERRAAGSRGVQRRGHRTPSPMRTAMSAASRGSGDHRRRGRQRAGAPVRRRRAGGGPRPRAACTAEAVGWERGARRGRLDRGRRAAARVAGALRRRGRPACDLVLDSRSAAPPRSMAADEPPASSAAWRAIDQLVPGHRHGHVGGVERVRGPRPARPLVGRAGLGQAGAGAHDRRVARRRRGRDADRGSRRQGQRRTPTRRSRRSVCEGETDERFARRRRPADVDDLRQRGPPAPRGARAVRGTDEDAYARRAAGEVACGTTLDLGRLRLDCAFFRWRMERQRRASAATTCCGAWTVRARRLAGAP